MDLDLIQVLDGVVDKLLVLELAEESGRGRRGYHPASMIACFLVMFLKPLRSERDLAAYIKHHEELWPCLRLTQAPVATTYGRFRRRFGCEKLAEIMDHVGSGFLESGEVVVDSALMEKKDPDAKRGYSQHKGIVTGFKAHVSCDAESGLPLRVRLTTGNRHDSPLLPELTSGLQAKAVVADAGYDSEKNINHILSMNAFPAIAFNKRADQGKGYAKTDSNRHKLRKKRKRKKLLKKRYIVEQLNNLLHETLELKNRFIQGLQACSFYLQLAALRLLAQAQWAIRTNQPTKKRQIKHFQRR